MGDQRRVGEDRKACEKVRGVVRPGQGGAGRRVLEKVNFDEVRVMAAAEVADEERLAHLSGSCHEKGLMGLVFLPGFHGGKGFAFEHEDTSLILSRAGTKQKYNLYYGRTEQLANPIHHISMQLSNLNKAPFRHFYNSRPVSAAAPELLSTSSHAASASA